MTTVFVVGTFKNVWKTEEIAIHREILNHCHLNIQGQ